MFSKSRGALAAEAAKLFAADNEATAVVGACPHCAMKPYLKTLRPLIHSNSKLLNKSIGSATRQTTAVKLVKIFWTPSETEECQKLRSSSGRTPRPGKDQV